MDEERRYAEEPEPRWYSGQSPQSSYDGPSPYDSGVHERPDHAFRLPESRPGDSRPGDAPRIPLTGGVDSLAPATAYPVTEAAFPGTDPVGYAGVDRYRPDPVTGAGGLTRGAPYATRDGDDPTSGRTTPPTVRVPLRGTEYPAVRPSGAVAPGDTGTRLGTQPDRPASLGDTSTRSGDTGTRLGDTGTRLGSGRAGGGMAGGGAAYNEPTSLVPPVGSRTGDGPGADRAASDRGAGGRFGGDAVYRTRRPAAALVFAVITAVLMIPVVRLLIQATFVDDPAARGIVPAVLITLGLPMTGFGLYAVVGAGRALDRAALSRPPAGYLLVGLVLLVAAGLATG